MSLAHVNLEKLRSKILSAYKMDDPILGRFRGYARVLRQNLKPLRTYSGNAVSFVSTDGGDNRISFNPATVELIRVVDSNGDEQALDAIASTTSIDQLADRVDKDSPNCVDPLARMCSDLGLTRPLTDLSYLLRAMGQAGKSTGAIQCYRDIVEWAVLYNLITNPSVRWGNDTILVRDGLLRTKSFTRDVFPKIDMLIRSGIAEHQKRNIAVSVVGVAKQSAVLSRLAVALELEETFHRSFPCYVEVPAELETECYNFDRTWLSTYETSEQDDQGRRLYQSMGKLFLVKFGDQSLDPVWPVDVAVWQVPQVERILGQLTVDSQAGFPIPNYPMCIQKAHGYAKMTGLEVEVLQDLLVKGMCEHLTSGEVDKLLRIKYLGQSLASARYKEA